MEHPSPRWGFLFRLPGVYLLELDGAQGLARPNHGHCRCWGLTEGALPLFWRGCTILLPRNCLSIHLSSQKSDGLLDTLHRAEATKLSWPLPEAHDDAHCGIEGGGSSASYRGLRARRDELLNEAAQLLAQRATEKIDIVISGARAADRSAPLAVIGHTLLGLQNLTDSIARAIHSGPTARGPLPVDVLSKSELRLTAVHVGLFRATAVGRTTPDLFGESLLVVLSGARRVGKTTIMSASCAPELCRSTIDLFWQNSRHS